MALRLRLQLRDAVIFFVAIFLGMALHLIIPSTLYGPATSLPGSEETAAEVAAWVTAPDVPAPEPQPWFPGEHNPLFDYIAGVTSGPVLAKWEHYINVYHRHLAKFRGTNLTMIEVGVQSGGSLLMWKWYFGPQARIVGIDINKACLQFAKPEDNVFVMIGDQTDTSFWQRVRDFVGGEYHIFLDDGGHKVRQQNVTFYEMYPKLSPTGVYICEDLHTNYWRHYGGGYKGNTFIETMKDHIDKINGFQAHFRGQLRERKGDELLPGPDDFTLSTDNIHFYDSMIVIEKWPRKGPRLIHVGNREIPYS